MDKERVRSKEHDCCFHKARVQGDSSIRQVKLLNSKVSEIPIVFENRKRGKSKLTISEIVTFSKYILKVLWEQTFSRET